MEETQVATDNASTTAKQAPVVKVRPLADWPATINIRSGSRKLLRDIYVWHDFNWIEFMGHDRTVFPRCKCFAQRVYDDCPDGKVPVLFLTNRDGITVDTAENEWYRVVVANVTLVLESESYSHFLEKAAKRPLTDLVAREDLLVAALAEVEQNPKFRERLEETLEKTDSRDNRAKLQKALKLIEGCEDITDSEVTELVTLLRKLNGTTVPLDEMLDSLAEVADIVRWIQAEPDRLERLREALDQTWMHLRLLFGKLQRLSRRFLVSPPKTRSNCCSR